MAGIKPQPTHIARSRALILFCLALALAAAPALLAQQADDPAQSGPPPQQDASASYDATAASPAADPPSRVARLSIAQGNVSLEPASVNQFSPADLNDPLTTGDRLWADNGAQAELEAGQLALRLGEATDLTVTAMTDALAQFGLAQGSVHLRTYALDPGTTTELDTPNVAITVTQPGDVRVDVDPNSDTTIVTLISGEVEVDGNGLQQTLQPGQRVRLAGTDPVSAQWLQAVDNDGLDSFSAERDQAYEGAESAEQSYLNPDTVGGADLAQYGDWTPDADYGDVWYPTQVAVGWQPYCYGHWTWVAPWGWTWVESEPWGFAPFHYGRWTQVRSRWGWIPGPPVVHPVYSPGLVVFVRPGTGVTAWFPLGPNEPYAPWYHASALYLNRVNVSNIYSRDPSQVRAIYKTSNREVYANPLGASQRFTNRSSGTIAVSQTNFAAGRPVASAVMHLPAAQLSTAAVLPHPLVSPERSMVAPTEARALPPRAARPSLASHQDNTVRQGATAGRATPPAESTPQIPQNRAPQNQPAPIERRGYTSGQPSVPSTQPSRPVPSPAAPAQGDVRPESPIHGTEQLPQANTGTVRREPANPPQQQRPQEQQQEQPLYNRAVPPPARPSFDQQRQAIQNTDPGRPLSPQQLDNLRDSRPVGQPQTREAAPHPAPAPPPRSAPAPAPRSSPPPSRSETRH
jgi:hypothetical protein